MLGKADQAQRARDRLPRSTAAGDDTLRNRIEPMHGQRRTLQKRLERQPASAVTTSPRGGVWEKVKERQPVWLPICASLFFGGFEDKIRAAILAVAVTVTVTEVYPTTLIIQDNPEGAGETRDDSSVPQPPATES